MFKQVENAISPLELVRVLRAQEAQKIIWVELSGQERLIKSSCSWRKLPGMPRKHPRHKLSVSTNIYYLNFFLSWSMASCFFQFQDPKAPSMDEPPEDLEDLVKSLDPWIPCTSIVKFLSIPHWFIFWWVLNLRVTGLEAPFEESCAREGGEEETPLEHDECVDDNQHVPESEQNEGQNDSGPEDDDELKEDNKRKGVFKDPIFSYTYIYRTSGHQPSWSNPISGSKAPSGPPRDVRGPGAAEEQRWCERDPGGLQSSTSLWLLKNFYRPIEFPFLGRVKKSCAKLLKPTLPEGKRALSWAATLPPRKDQLQIKVGQKARPRLKEKRLKKKQKPNRPKPKQRENQNQSQLLFLPWPPSLPPLPSESMKILMKLSLRRRVKLVSEQYQKHLILFFLQEQGPDDRSDLEALAESEDYFTIPDDHENKKSFA